MELKVIKAKISPMSLLLSCQQQKGIFLLESSLTDTRRGRYSILGYDPFFTVKGNTLSDFLRFKKRVQSYSIPRVKGVPFPAGVVGYLSYDFGLEFEKISTRHSKSSIPGFLFRGYEGVMIFDHDRDEVTVTSTGLAEKNQRLRSLRAKTQLNRFLSKMDFVSAPAEKKQNLKLQAVHAHFSRAQYLDAVRQALAAIKAGDIYQVNLSQGFDYLFKEPVDGVSLYRALRELSPSYYGGYFDAGSFQIVSSSPELFLKLEHSKVETRPMKGTASRYPQRDRDRAMQQALRESAKERAELLMITDLERNDLGRVCEFGSVKVKTLREIEKYKTVFQATATITGKLRADCDAFDLLQASFPGGSITGCPKIRAMEIIDQLECTSRGIYTGAFGYLSFSGDLLMNILIRTLLVKRQQVTYHVGGGIVSDSVPQREYDETLLKAKAMKTCLTQFKASPGV